jgi:hypothetical protein
MVIFYFKKSNYTNITKNIYIKYMTALCKPNTFPFFSRIGSYVEYIIVRWGEDTAHYVDSQL